MAPFHTTIGTVLLVEDHAPLRRNLAFLLQAAGFEVAMASNGQEAITLLGKTNPNIIISDIDMPQVDGYGLLRFVRDSLEWHNTPFILTSAKYDYDDLINGLELGANDYLPKPFDIYDVLDAIQRVAPDVIANGRQPKAS
jgi:DNA-binding response OmpR family regulator